MSNNESASGSSLARQTLRTVGILVAACVLFVGALSLIAVFVTSRVVGPRATEATATDTTPSAKKPLSI